MRRYISSNGLTPATNRFIGSTLHFIIFITVIFISYKIWGIKMFEEIIFYALETLSFLLVKIILIITKAWDH